MQDVTVKDRLDALVQRVTGGEPLSVVPMPGGGSTRSYFRVELPNGSSAVAMHVPDAAQPHEIVKTNGTGCRWPFLEVRDLLQDHGVHVPRILGEACDDGWLLVEDLGDDTLANYLLRDPGQKTRLYQTAVRDLARAQQALLQLPATCIVAQRAFDEDLLRWEVEHFREWALEARGVELTAGEREVFENAARYLATTIAHWPRGFVHRDYQSRNLMVRLGNGEPELVWIDFQDALLGPRVYDLVALLGDSYQTFDPAFVETRIDEYASHLRLSSEERLQLGREFDAVMVQRKLKDAGRFVFFDRKNKNPHFLQFVDSTIGKARAAMQRLSDVPELRALHEMLEPALNRAS